MKTLLVLGADGYLGYPVSLHFASKGWSVTAVDNLSKRFNEMQKNVSPLIELPSYKRRFLAWNEKNPGKAIQSHVIDIATQHRLLYSIIEEIQPDAVIHFAEQPSAPFSMYGRSEAVSTQINNVSGTLNLLFAVQKIKPDCHIVKLGTMGEYGTPNIDIEEGWLDIEHNGRTDRVLFPKKPGSFYHLSKVHDSNNLEYACRTWGTRVTDLNQGIVYGSHSKETSESGLHTSFHYDSIFGTAINRFVAQGLSGQPLTVYGSGTQERAYLHINDVLNCIDIALNNPAQPGEFKVRNQFTESKSINSLAELVVSALKSSNIDSSISHIDNPRVEEASHYYNPKNQSFIDNGLQPILMTESIVAEMINYLLPYKDNIDTSVFMPNVRWRGGSCSK